MQDLHTPDLSIGDVADRTGIGVSTLRMWEDRYGFPEPHRTPSGHRRYTEEHCRLILAVARARDGGASMPAAVANALAVAATPPPSIFLRLQEVRPELIPMRLSKVGMLAVSRAIEDVVAARAQSPILVGAFQRETFWRATEPRWRDLARTAHVTVALAALPRASHRGGVHEVPIADGSLLHREWAIVCDAPNVRAVLAGVERPGPRPRRGDRHREFEAVWTVDPDIVREAARVAVAIAAERVPAIAEACAGRLAERPVTTMDSLSAATTLTNRIVHNLERWRS